MRLTQGEIADRISILELKQFHGLDVKDELEELRKEWKGNEDDLEALRFVNCEAWAVVGRVHQYFDWGMKADNEVIVGDCRIAHSLNKKRVGIKNKINKEFGEFIEHKTWKDDGSVLRPE